MNVSREAQGEVDGGSGNSDADYINHDDITPQSHRDVNGAPLPPLVSSRRRRDEGRVFNEGRGRKERGNQRWLQELLPLRLGTLMTSLSDSSQEKERHTLGGGPKTRIMSERGGNNVAQDLGEVKKSGNVLKCQKEIRLLLIVITIFCEINIFNELSASVITQALGFALSCRSKHFCPSQKITSDWPSLK